MGQYTVELKAALRLKNELDSLSWLLGQAIQAETNYPDKPNQWAAKLLSRYTTASGRTEVGAHVVIDAEVSEPSTP